MRHCVPDACPTGKDLIDADQRLVCLGKVGNGLSGFAVNSKIRSSDWQGKLPFRAEPVAHSAALGHCQRGTSRRGCSWSSVSA
jgi:hypothetical protein